MIAIPRDYSENDEGMCVEAPVEVWLLLENSQDGFTTAMAASKGNTSSVVDLNN